MPPSQSSAPKAPKRAARKGEVTYLIERRLGSNRQAPAPIEQLLITFPASYRVTFGPLNPGRHGERDTSQTLRIYDGTCQRAIFENVVSFRDVGMPLKRRVLNGAEVPPWLEDQSTVGLTEVESF